MSQGCRRDSLEPCPLLPQHPIVFLDLDGVLITEWSLRQEKQWLDELTTFEPYDPACVAALNAIIAACNPRFVLHSNRRFQYSLADMKAIWQACGVASADIRLLTAYADAADQWFDHPNDEKAYDISAFIADRRLKPGNYVVIDDEPIPADGLVQTKEAVGLAMSDTSTVIELLSGPRWPRRDA